MLTPRIVSISVSVLVLAFMAGCSSEQGTTEDTAEPSGGWVKITSPNDTGYADTFCNSLMIRGEAFISQDYYACCSGSATDTGVTVSWENLVSGSSGNASQSIDYCVFFGTPVLCDHTWSASVPLVLGDNIIRITARDPGGTGGTDSITISKPEYSYKASGLVSTYDGLGLGYFQSSVELGLTGNTVSRVITNSAGDMVGSYQFTCLPDGAYSVAPSTQVFDYSFSPAFRDFIVAGQDISNLDFQTAAYPLTGRITNSSDMPISSFIAVKINDGNGEWLRSVEEDGTYTYIVPNGTYTITPIDTLCESCSFTPAQRVVDVTDGGLSALDFVKQ